MQRLAIPVVSLVLLFLLQGCVLPPKATTPMEAIWMEQHPGSQADTLFIFLPGRRDKPEDFLKYQFMDRLWEAGVQADVVLPNAHIGYYYEKVFTERFLKDIIEEARARGYQHFYAVGVSLGGFGAIMFERDFPGTWAGIFLIAPFTGDQNAVLNKILEADSVQDVSFKPPLTEDDYTARFWEWLQRYERNPSVPIFLGYGLGDRMHKEHDRIAYMLPNKHVFTIPGTHNWKVWEKLWVQIISAACLH